MRCVGGEESRIGDLLNGVAGLALLVLEMYKM
jgi:hypothetical protein